MSSRPKARTTSSARIARAKATSDSRASATTRWIVGAVAAVVVLALVIAVAATRSSSTSPSSSIVYGNVAVTGAALPTTSSTVAGASASTDPAVGQTVPTVEGQAYDGSSVTIPAAGTPKVVMFVAHWCPHCQKEVPLITRYLAEKGLPTDVDLYAVSTSTSESQPNFPASDWLQKEQWPVKTIADDEANSAAEAYGVSGFPYFVAVDADGKVVARASGELTMEQFQSLIDQAK